MLKRRIPSKEELKKVRSFKFFFQSVKLPLWSLSPHLVRPSVHTTIYRPFVCVLRLYLFSELFFFLTNFTSSICKCKRAWVVFFCCYYNTSFEFLCPRLGMKDLKRKLGRSVGRQRSGRFRHGQKRGKGQGEGKREMLHKHTMVISPTLIS